MKFVVTNTTIINADGRRGGSVWVKDGKIAAVGFPPIDMVSYEEEIDGSPYLLMPGGIDVHTHLDMPFGGTVSADDYESGTQAAAIGGTTTVIDFALQNQSGTLKQALDTWLKKSEGKACIDFSLHMAVTNLHGAGGEDTLREMEQMVAAGITSFKLFMAYPNVLMVDDGLMFKVMRKAAELNALCLVHAENGTVIDIVVAEMLAAGKTAPRYHALSRDPRAEAEATYRAISIAELAGAAVYIVHLSNSFALDALKLMQKRGAKALAETCTQYLTLDRDNCMPGYSWDEAKYVFTPPLRGWEHRQPLWDGLRDGSLSVVSTDHCPFTMEQKALGKNDFSKIPNGGPGVENRMQVLWMDGVFTGMLSPEKFVELCCWNPAKIFGMGDRKGRIEVGYDADFVLWDPNVEYTISASTQRMANDYNLFEGKYIRGNAAKVFSRGELVVDNVLQPGKFLGATGRGQFVKREANAGGLGVIAPVRNISMDSDQFAGEFAPDARLYNDDLAPTMPAQRTWSTYNYIALWFSMSMEVTTYMLAASLIAGGMNWKQAVGTILLGNLIVLVPMLLNAHAGAKYGIPFPVFVRSSFGPVGANIPALLRAVVACGWFGIQCWIGGTAIAQMIAVLSPQTAAMPWVVWACFLGFWLLNMVVVWRGVESIRFLQSFSAPFMVVMSLTLLVFMYRKAGGFGPMLAAPSSFADTHSFLKFFLPSLTAMVGYWATLSLNIPDFTRYAKNQESQLVGQAFGLPVAMTLYSFLGIAVTSASTVVFGHPIWSPVELLGRFHQPLIAFLGLIALLVATLNVNIGANVVGPSNDFSNLAPRLVSFRTGGLITGLLGLAIMPWRLVSSSHNFLGWLVDYSGLLGPVAGIMVADYFLVRHTRLDSYSLYRRGGIYEYRNGFNLVALFALALGIAAALVGRFVPSLDVLFKMAWFVGFFLSGGVYWLLMLGGPREASEAIPRQV